MNRSELLAIADAAADLRADEQSWLLGLSEAFERARPRARATVAHRYASSGGRPRLAVEVTRGDVPGDLDLFGTKPVATDDVARWPWDDHAAATTAAARHGGRLPPALEASLGPYAVHDVLSLSAGLGDGCTVAMATAEQAVVDPAEAKELGAVAHALRVSLALRQVLTGRPLCELARAIFSPDGSCQQRRDASLDAELGDVAARVREREEARVRFERDGDPRSLSTWRQLSAGELMLVDELDDAGRRLVVLVPTPLTGDLRALTATEARVARLAGRALSNKEIGFELGLGETAVANHLARALRKLRLKSRMALVRLYTQLETAGEA